jgi:hypothetical protein
VTYDGGVLVFIAFIAHILICGRPRLVLRPRPPPSSSRPGAGNSFTSAGSASRAKYSSSCTSLASGAIASRTSSQNISTLSASICERELDQVDGANSLRESFFDGVN